MEEKKMALTPPMGWLSWNLCGRNVNETIIREMADTMESSGMLAAGYQYIIIDDCWSVKKGRDQNGNLMADPEKFPSGIKALADYVHSKGLKLGIYSDACRKTCEGYPGSYGYEKNDAQLFASWGIDYLKYDYLMDVPEGKTAAELYGTMGEELKKCGREIVFAVCEWGYNQPWKWARKAGGRIWRTTWDIRDHWEFPIYDGGHNGIMNAVDANADLSEYAGNGGWNDMDMLVVGLYNHGAPSSTNGANGCTDEEYRTQMSMWCMMASPLMASCDLRNMNEATRDILMNAEIIAIDQDPLGIQGTRICRTHNIEIWKKELDQGETAIAVLNRGDKEERMDLVWKEYGIQDKINVRDVWKHETIGTTETVRSTVVESHETKVFRIF